MKKQNKTIEYLWLKGLQDNQYGDLSAILSYCDRSHFLIESSSQNWFKKAYLQKEAEWQWSRFFRYFGGTVLLGAAALAGMNLTQLQKLYAENPNQAVAIVQKYQDQNQENNQIDNNSLSQNVLNNQSFIQNNIADPNSTQDKGLSDPNSIQSVNLKDMIKRHEGYKNKVYQDTKGIPTIGVGFNLQKPGAKEMLLNVGADIDKILKGEPLTDAQIESLLNEDIKTAINDARNFLPNFNDQPPSIQNILIDMAFNMGFSTLNQFNSFKENLLKKDYSAAANNMIRSKWYKQVGNRSIELVNRMQLMSEK